MGEFGLSTDATLLIRAGLYMNKPDPVWVGIVCMLPSLFLNSLKTSPVGSSWEDLPKDLKMQIIDSFARASKTTSCKQVVRLCEDADCDEDEYKKLFLILKSSLFLKKLGIFLMFVIPKN